MASLLFLVVRAVALLPVWSHKVITRFGVVVFPLVAPKEMQKLWLNLEKIYHLPRHSGFATQFARQVLQHQIVAALESLNEIFYPGSVEVVNFDEFAGFISELEGRGKGVVLVTGHLGSWELMGKFAAKACRGKLHVLAKPSRSDAVTQVLDRLRTRMNTRVLWTNSKSLLKSMLKVLRNGETLGFVMDQKPLGRVGPSFDFLGHPAEFVTGPATVASKLGAPVVAVFCVRTSKLRYRMGYNLVCDDPAGRDVEQLTRDMVEEIERMVSRYPEQWTWGYKRWKFQAAQ